jgi:Nif-specific regulatory protein
MALDAPTPFDPLLEIGAALSERGGAAALPRVLEILREALGAVSGAITLADDSGALRIEASFGFASPTPGALPYRPGEGITGRVFQSGRAVVVPRISEEPLIMDRSGVRSRGRHAKGDCSFYCLPILQDGRPAGTLALAVPFAPDRPYQRETALLQVAAALTGLAVKVARMTAADRQRLLEENRTLRHELQERYEIRNLLGTSNAMREVFEQVAQAAPGSTTVLLRGESGTGKELAAKAVHYASARSERPFVKVSCAALPEALLEPELFGYEPGAFPGAHHRSPGRLERAHGGTLFLDEVGELPPGTQAKLLRVLQEREFERLGGSASVKVDVRIVASTHRNLEEAMARGAFREDLYYRLNVFEIFLPPLRERSTDILLLADHFVEKFAVAHGQDVRRISHSAIDLLTAYHWPGNVRELENCIERAVLVCGGGVIHGHHLPPSLQTAEASGTLLSVSLEATVAAFERDLIQDALKSARGNRARAARLLQTTERILTYKARKLAIDPDRFKGR